MREGGREGEVREEYETISRNSKAARTREERGFHRAKDLTSGQRC